MPSLLFAAGIFFGLAAASDFSDPLEEFERRFANRLEAQVEDRCSSIASAALAAQVEALDALQSGAVSPPASLLR